MKLISEPQQVILRKEELDKLITQEEKDTYLKTNNLIKIKPTRLENIKIEIIFETEKIYPDDIEIYFYTEQFQGWYIHPYNLRHLLAPIKIDEKLSKFQILNTGSVDQLQGIFSVHNICFHSRKLKTDFEFYVDVNLKYTYQIHAGKLVEEIWYNEGQCYHNIGANFPY